MDLLGPKLQNKFSLKFVVAISLLLSSVALSAIFAANISLNNGVTPSAEGLTIVTSCDSNVTFTPESHFAPANLPSPTPTASSGPNPTSYYSYDYRLGNFVFANLDLTPEGADLAVDPLGNEQAIDASSHAGKYKNTSGEWVKTCLGKWFVVSAFPTSGFEQYTLGSSIDSPIATSCLSNCALSSNSLLNFGYAFRVTKSAGQYQSEIATQSVGKFDAQDLDIFIQGTTPGDSTVSLGFGFKYTTVPADSIKTVTLESFDSLPSGFTIAGCNVC